MKTMNTKELNGAALNYAVALAEGFKLVYDEISEDFFCQSADTWSFLKTEYKPSSDWSQYGVIIEREQITITPSGERVFAECKGIMCNGKTMLIAAMRAYVASKLGRTVEIPDELVD